MVQQFSCNDRLKRVQENDPRLVSQQDVDMAFAKYQEAQSAVRTLQTMVAYIDKLRVYVYVPKAAYRFIRRGTPAVLRFDEFPNRVFRGSVARYATSLDLATRTMLTEVDIDNPGHLLYPRSYAHVTLDLVRHPNVLSVPAAAIESNGKTTRVLVNKAGRLAAVQITTRINDGSRIEVTSGLTDNSLVVDTYSNALTPGEHVRFALRKVTSDANARSGQVG